MMSITHATIAIAGVSVALGVSDPGCLVLAVIGSQLPDLDTTSSLCGSVLFPIARILETRFPHRTITHSFLSTAITATIAAPLWVLGWQYWAALTLGQFLGWFADSFTKSGVAAFYPSPVRLVIPGNPKARLSTHSTAEYWVLAVCVIVAVISTNLASAGGINESFERAFFSDPATAAKLFTKHGSDRMITIDLQGQNIATSQPVKGMFTVIEATDRELVCESANDGQLYKVGSSPDSQIQPTSVKTNIGDRISVSAQPQTLQEIGVSDWVRRLPQNSYLNGSLLLDDMNDLRLSSPVGVYPSLRVFGGQLELRNARPVQLAQIRDYWILQGQVVVKVRK